MASYTSWIRIRMRIRTMALIEAGNKYNIHTKSAVGYRKLHKGQSDIERSDIGSVWYRFSRTRCPPIEKDKQYNHIYFIIE
jgi:hypothetical protein